MLIFSRFIIGSIIGSFLCLVAERIPLNQSVLSPASHCSFCKKKILMCDLVPLLSILFLRFRCRYCKRSLSPIYFFSELSCGFLFVSCLSTHFTWQQLITLGLFLFALTLSLTDYFYFIVEPKIFYSGGLLIGGSYYFIQHELHPVSCLFIVFSLIVIRWIFPDSIGDGDILFIGFLSLILDAIIIFQLLFIASGLGALFFILCPLISKQPIIKIPFIPFLSIGLFFSNFFL